MHEETIMKRLGDQAAWLWIIGVFVCLIVILVMVYSHDKEKPQSPHALVAAGFNQMFPIQEWSPGMGKKPFVYHQAAAIRREWKPLPPRAGMKSGGLQVGYPSNGTGLLLQ